MEGGMNINKYDGSKKNDDNKENIQKDKEGEPVENEKLDKYDKYRKQIEEITDLKLLRGLNESFRFIGKDSNNQIYFEVHDAAEKAKMNPKLMFFHQDLKDPVSAKSIIEWSEMRSIIEQRMGEIRQKETKERDERYRDTFKDYLKRIKESGENLRMHYDVSFGRMEIATSNSKASGIGILGGGRDALKDFTEEQIKEKLCKAIEEKLNNPEPIRDFSVRLD